MAKIRAGTGPYDVARDLVDLVGLYREHAAGLRDKLPFTDAWFAEAEAVGTWLMANITPTGAPKVSADAAAAVLFEGKAATIVPPLQSRAATASAGSPAAEEEKPAEPVVTEPVVAEPVVVKPAEPVVAEPVTPGNSTPPAPMRPKSAQARETRATARRRR